MSLVQKRSHPACLENIGNAAGQCHRVATCVALHAFRLTSCSRCIEGVTRVRGLHPFARHLCIEMFFALLRVVKITPATLANSDKWRSTIKTALGLWLDRLMASSSSGLYATTLPPREPASALMITLGVASSMRVANACGQIRRTPPSE